MPVEIKVPSVGESVTEGILSRWLKKDGDAVRADEPVVELETDKATQEVVAPAAGRLRTAVNEGATVQVGAVIGRIEEGAEATAPPKQPPKEAKQKAQKEAAGKIEKVTEPAAMLSPRPAAREPALSPAARVAAEARGIDASRLTGSGRGGRVTKQDVLEHRPEGNGARREPTSRERERAEEVTHPAAHAPGSSDRETRQRMSAVRQRIAARLVESQRATASLTTFNEVDLSAVIELRSRYKDTFKEKHGVRLGFMSFFVKASVEALKTHPLVNARLDGPDVVYQNFYDIGVAVSTEKGLMVPIVRDCDSKGFAEIETEIAGLAGKAHDGKISVSDLQGGTFTITNGGLFGSLLSTPILNPPQTAILGMHAIQKRPVVDNDAIVVRPMMYLALTYDHRLIDGREAVLFLMRVKECVESPERLMLEI
jgi:2-oxoglutarate dehydrogenase E2 component (dihydrolipoamide succinyltransferase)